MIKRTFALFIFLFLINAVKSSDYGRLLFTQLVQKADVIIIGKAYMENGEFYIKVKKIIEGDCSKNIWIKKIYFVSKEKLVERNEEVIWFLRYLPKYGSYSIFHPNCIKLLDDIKKVRRAIDIWKSPKKYLNVQKYGESKEINYVYGQLFKAFRIQSKEAPKFAKYLKNSLWELTKDAPWDEQILVTLTIEFDEEYNCHIYSNHPKSPLSTYFTQNARRAFKHYSQKEKLPKSFTVSIDNRAVLSNKGLVREKAMKYLHDRLKSRDWKIIISALSELSKIASFESVEKVVPLLNHNTNILVEKAVDFLGLSKDEEVSKLIAEIFIEKIPSFRNNLSMVNACYIALENMDAPENVEYFEFAAQYGMDSAIRSLREVGRPESFSVLIQTLEKEPESFFTILKTLYWLVRRSNKKLELWMTISPPVGKSSVYKDKIPMWLNWWEKHKEDIQMIYTFSEVEKAK